MRETLKLSRLSQTHLKRSFSSFNSSLRQSIAQACNLFIDQSHVKTQQPAHDTPRPNQDLLLRGLKVAIKDIFCMHQTPTTCASKALKDFISPYDSHVVSKLLQHGAEIIGKTNMDEFSMGSSSTNSYFGPVINPLGYDLNKNEMLQFHSAGGSSGGSAAAVAAGECDIAIGSDTGGSIRLPAAYCGVMGMKPSYGLISRYGMIQYSHSLDTVGILSTKINLIRKAFSCLEGYDPQDPTSISLETRLKSKQLCELWLKTRINKKSEDLSDLRVGVPIEYFTSDLSDQVIEGFKTAVDFFKQHGAQFTSISLPTTETCLGAYYVIASAEASSNLARYSGLHYGYRSSVDYPSPENATADKPEQLYAATRSEAFGIEVKKRLLLGSYVLSASGMENYFLQAQQVRLQVQAEFDQNFRLPNVLNNSMDESRVTTTSTPEIEGGVDVIMTPATMSTAPSLTGSVEIDSEWNQDRLLVPASLAGLPAIVIPIQPKKNKSSDWPIGIQLISQWGTEDILLHVGSILERINLKH